MENVRVKGERRAPPNITDRKETSVEEEETEMGSITSRFLSIVIGNTVDVDNGREIENGLRRLQIPDATPLYATPVQLYEEGLRERRYREEQRQRRNVLYPTPIRKSAESITEDLLRSIVRRQNEFLNRNIMKAEALLMWDESNYQASFGAMAYSVLAETGTDWSCEIEKRIDGPRGTRFADVVLTLRCEGGNSVVVVVIELKYVKASYLSYPKYGEEEARRRYPDFDILSENVRHGTTHHFSGTYAGVKARASERDENGRLKFEVAKTVDDYYENIERNLGAWSTVRALLDNTWHNGARKTIGKIANDAAMQCAGYGNDASSEESGSAKRKTTTLCYVVMGTWRKSYLFKCVGNGGEEKAALVV
jgi:hypothetical protein